MSEPTKENLSLVESAKRIWKHTLFSSEIERPTANRIICNLLLASIILCCIVATYQALKVDTLLNGLSSSVYEYGVYTVLNIVLIELVTIAMVMLVHYDRKGQFTMARYVSRILVVLIVAAVLTCLAVNGVNVIEVFYIFQFGCVIAYQIVNDPNISYNAPWYNPFSKKAKRNAEEAGLLDSAKYIPLNFFNLFWVFVIGCMIGVAVETWFCWFERGVIEDRAGLLYGPFSPIYGVGATLMTVALNRVWNKPWIVAFIISAVVGAGVEWLVSFYMETAFGISAWDYSGAPGSIDGRTDLSHAVAWGILGVFWIRLILPITMRCVDAISFKWRTSVTIICFVLMLANAGMTLLALESWGQRKEGVPIEGAVQTFFEQNYNDDWMDKRFETMSFKKDIIAEKANVEGSLEAGDSPG